MIFFFFRPSNGPLVQKLDQMQGAQEVWRDRDPIIISGQGRMARWLVGGRCVKEKLSEINFYQHQTLSNIKIDQYKQLFNQQKSSQASGDSSDRASEDCLILPASLPASLEQLRQMLLQAARPTSTMCWSLRHIWASSLEGVHAMVSLKSCSESSYRSGTDVTPFTWTIKTNGFAKKKNIQMTPEVVVSNFLAASGLFVTKE